MQDFLQKGHRTNKKGDKIIAALNKHPIMKKKKREIGLKPSDSNKKVCLTKVFALAILVSLIMLLQKWHVERARLGKYTIFTD